MMQHVYRTAGLASVFWLGFTTAAHVPTALGAVTAPPGYIYNTQLLGSTTQSCVAAGPGGTFVAIGPGFTANAQAVVLVKESGTARLVAFGFTSVTDCVYDAAHDVLYVADNADAGDVPGAITGDTVFAFASASTVSGLTAAGHELVPANTVPFAASLALDGNGNLFVSDSVGGGAGRVLKIQVSGPTVTPFASGLDYAAGLAVDPVTGDLLVAETRSSFDAQIRRFNALGTEQPLFAGPSFAFGSYDLAFTQDGHLLSTGLFHGDVVSFNAQGAALPFAKGFTSAGGVTTNKFTGRVEIVSGFSGTDEDRSLHRFTPVDLLVRGRGQTATECVHEFYGVQLAAPAQGARTRAAICVDGDACDADGTVNDSCLFPVGFCLNVPDPGVANCLTNSPVTDFSVVTRPVSSAVTSVVNALQAALPASGPTCVFSDGVVVPVKIRQAQKRDGTALVKVKAATADGREDKDAIQLRCVPAGA